MSGKLVTIATFDQAAKAHLAQHALTEAGIKSSIADEAIVTMDWLLAPAVGFIKLQVLDEDSERAVNALEGTFGANGDGEDLGSDSVDAEELAAQAEAAPREGSRELPTGEPIVPASADREDSARRMVFVAALGLFFPPLAFFALYLFLNAAFGEGALSPRGRFNLWIGGAMMLGGLCWMGLFLRLFYG